MAWYDPRTWFTPTPSPPAPQKSTIVDKQPPIPSMTITLPSGQKVQPKPVPTQKPEQFTPKAGGTTTYTAPSGGGGGGSYQPVSQQPQPVSSVDTFREPASTPFSPVQKSIQEKQTTKSTKDLSIPESRVDVFSPFKTKTRKEVGAEEGFLGKLKNKDFDNLFVTTKDISKEPYPKLPYQTRGTEVIGQPDLTFGDVKTGREIIAGTYGRPAEFVFQDIGFGLQKEGQEELSDYEKSIFEEMQPIAQKEMDKAFGEIQGKVTSGEWSLEKGQKSLERRQSELERYFGTKAGEKITLKQTEIQGKIETEFKEKSGSQGYLIGLAKGSPTEIKTDWKVPLEIGAWTIGGIVAPVTTGNLLTFEGATMVTKGAGRAVLGEDLSLTERGVELGKVGLGIALMYGGFKGATGLVEKSIIKGELKALSRQPVMYNEPILTKGGEAIFAVIKGKQAYKWLETEFTAAGRIFKQGESGFIMPSGKLVRKTSGVLDWDIMGKGQGTIISAKETAKIGSKGLTFDIVEGKIYGTVGKGTLIPIEKTSAMIAVPTTEKEMLKASKSFVKQYDKNLIRFDTDEGMIKDYFGGVSVKAEEDLFYTRGGKIVSKESFGLAQTEKGLVKETEFFDFRGMVDVGRGAGGAKVKIQKSVTLGGEKFAGFIKYGKEGDIIKIAKSTPEEELKTYVHEKFHEGIIKLRRGGRLDENILGISQKDVQGFFKELKTKSVKDYFKGFNIPYKKEKIGEEWLASLVEGAKGKQPFALRSYEEKTKTLEFLREKGYPSSAKYIETLYAQPEFKLPSKNIIEAQLRGQKEVLLKGTLKSETLTSGEEWLGGKIKIAGKEVSLYKDTDKSKLFFGKQTEGGAGLIGFQNKDLGRVRLIEVEGKEPVFDIVGGTGLRGNLPEDTVRLFTGTTKSGAKGALESGLKPSKGFNEVYLVEPKDIEFTKGFAARRAIQSGEGIEILEANIPKSVFEELKVSRATGKGGMSEITLKNVPKQYLSIYTETPIETYSGQDLLSVLIKPTKQIRPQTLGSEIITKGLISEYATTPQSIYYGTGQYERTGELFGGAVLGGKLGVSSAGIDSGKFGGGLVFEPSYKTEVIPIITLTGRTDLGLGTKPLTKFTTAPSFYQPTTPTSGLGLVQGEAFGLKQDTLQKLKLKQITPSIIPPFTPTPAFDFKTRFGFGGGFILPSISVSEGRRGRQSKGRKFGYTPSIVSLGMRGTDFAKYFTATKAPTGLSLISGLISRPILKSKKSKRRKR